MDYSRKNPNMDWGVEDMEFPGVSKEGQMKTPGLIKEKFSFCGL